MDILEAFVANGISHNVNILWKEGEAFFRATEIGKALDIKKIHNTIKDFKDRHIVTDSMGIGGHQPSDGIPEITFLTECGLFKLLLMMCRKPIALMFLDWVTDVIGPIREKYKLDIYNKKIEEAIQKGVETFFQLEKTKLEHAKYEKDGDKQKQDDISNEEYCYENGYAYRNHTQVRGDKIQIYDPETKQLIKTFESLIEPTRDHEYMQDASRNMILNAIEKGTVYKKFRWLKLNRELSDDTIQDLCDTTEYKGINKGFVAMFDLSKSRIEKVFCDQKAAAENRNFKGTAAICKAIKLNSQSGGHYFKMWFDCEPEFKNEYLSREPLPSKRKAVNAITVQKLNPITKALIKEYNSIEEVLKEYKTTRSTIKNASENDFIVCGFKWQVIYNTECI